MSYYNQWGQAPGRDPVDLGEKAFSRKSLPSWDAKWHDLSAGARRAFLEEAKAPSISRFSSYGRNEPPVEKGGVPPEKFAPHVLKELIAAGFLEIRKTTVAKRQPAERVFVPHLLSDFMTRTRSLSRYHLLMPGPPTELGAYVSYVFHREHILRTISGILMKAGISDPYVKIEEAIPRYITNYRWPGWVVDAVKLPLAEKILEILKASDKPIPIAEIPALVGEGTPQKVRDTLDALIVRMAVFEDLQPGTWDVAVGVLPVVREGLAQAAKPRRRPALSACKSTREEGPDGSPVLDDLRAFLLELATEPPRLRQDGSLFQKEYDRFGAIFDPIPEWLIKVMGWNADRRLYKAHGLAVQLDLVKQAKDEKQIWLRLSPKGQKWLAASIGDLYRSTYEAFGKVESSHTTLVGLSRFDAGEDDDDFDDDDDDDYYFSYSSGEGDYRFYGISLESRKIEPTPKGVVVSRPKKDDIKVLRDAIYASLSSMRPGVYYPIDAVLEHCIFERENPLLLGLDPKQVEVRVSQRRIPPLMEFLEKAGREALDQFIRLQLIPLGCIRAAVDGNGQLCIARQPRLDAYFGRKVADEKMVGEGSGESRVVVQPDFSIIIIGLDPAPAAELAPFCERATRGGGQGALILKLTRESVVKAVSLGLKSSEILARLKRRATTEIPANVRLEVEEWSKWTREVTAEAVTVIRCPDRASADRVFAVLKRQGERLNETVVATTEKITGTLRGKLQDQGILVVKEAGGKEPKKASTTKKKSRRRY